MATASEEILEREANEVVEHCLQVASEAFTYDNVSYWLDKARVATHTKGLPTVSDVVYTKLVEQLGDDHQFVASFKKVFVASK